MAEKMNNLSGKEWLEHSFSIWRDIRKSQDELRLGHPAIFPSMLAKRVIEIYTKDNEEVILDPFAGTGSTLVAAVDCGRRAVGIELNPDFSEIAESRIAASQTELNPDLSEIADSRTKESRTDNEGKHPSPDNDKRVKVITGDSREVLRQIADESVDLCINSPPYWDILNQRRSVDARDISGYSDEKTDLGNISDYDDFLSQLKQVYCEVFRTLKPNKRCVCVVMDIRKKSQFYPLHLDLSHIMQEIGFEVEEFIIWDRQHEYNNMKPLGYPWVFRVNKVHEFICIFHKRE